MKRMIGVLLLLFLFGVHSLKAQQYTGMTGLIHTPSAEMNDAGTARIGAHFLNEAFSPAVMDYPTGCYYLNITPFSWIELAYTCTLLKDKSAPGYEEKIGYTHQDRYFSLKLRPLKEGKWWPAIALGTNDPYGTYGATRGSLYFSNFYVAASKRLFLGGNELAAHLSWRKFRRDYNAKWDGVVGGVTFRPAFAPNLRAIVEYSGDDVNLGVDVLLWKHFLLQISLQQGKHLSGGVCYQLNLF
ncbi:YjbH domain-containing protein [Parabacteroides sp. OttesenSCG-928-G06]|nr:YjbH domain-containing protein [Parabacteroides sp. OttesenSCG-928-K15]MDL2282115.1 YjbH domain-containing protein [Parabacteroides sp. OttesenSCG-928-G06]